MAIKTQAELLDAISSTLEDKGKNKASELRSILVDAVDTLFHWIANAGGNISWSSITGKPTDLAQKGEVNTYTRAQGFGRTILTDAASIAWDLDANQVARVTLGGNRALANPTNIKDGFTYLLEIRQDGTGNRTLSYGSAYKFQGGAAPVLSTAANAIDVLTCIGSSGNLHCVLTKDFK